MKHDDSRRVTHHTLPRMGAAMCGAKVPPQEFGGTFMVSWTDGTTFVSCDVSAVTCEACKKALYDVLPDKEVQQQMLDAGWLRTQGEDFASLRKLVEAVNESEKRLVGDEDHFKPGGKNTRAGYVKTISYECTRLQQRVSYLSGPMLSQRSGTPAGGLCHDDARRLIDSVRIGVGELRAGCAWPDDARRVAGDLERALESVVGVRERKALPAPAEGFACSRCNTFNVCKQPGELCAKCQKGAWARGRSEDGR